VPYVSPGSSRSPLGRAPGRGPARQPSALPSQIVTAVTPAAQGRKSQADSRRGRPTAGDAASCQMPAPCVLGRFAADGGVQITGWSGMGGEPGPAGCHLAGHHAQPVFVPELVSRDLVPDAVALNSVQFNTARMIGGAVGGLTVAAWGISGALFFNAATFLPILGVLLVIRAAHPPPRATAHASMLADLRAGLSYVARAVPVRRVVMVLGVVGLLGYNWQVAVPLIARFTLHRQVTGYGVLMSAPGGKRPSQAVRVQGPGLDRGQPGPRGVPELAAVPQPRPDRAGRRDHRRRVLRHRAVPLAAVDAPAPGRAAAGRPRQPGPRL
jgi:transmembrane secretion effector